MSKRKNWSREVSFLLFMWLASLSFMDGKVTTVEILVWPIFTFTMFAYGFASSSAQLQWPFKPPDGGRPEGSSQHTGGKDKHSDGR